MKNGVALIKPHEMKKLYLAALDKIVRSPVASEMHKPLDPGQATVKQTTFQPRDQGSRILTNVTHLLERASKVKNKEAEEKQNMKEDFHLYMKKEYEKIFNEDWFFDKITHQRAEELLIEKGRRGDFLVREDLEEGKFFLIWLDQENYLHHSRIVMNRESRKWNVWIKDGKKQLRTLHFDTFSDLLKDLIAHNIIIKPLGNKEEHKTIAERRFKNTRIPRFFCFHCESFQDNIHYCRGRELWQNMDPVNNLLLVGTTRKNVERSPEHVVENDEHNWYQHYKNKAIMLKALEDEARCVREAERVKEKEIKKEEEERIRRKEEEELIGDEEEELGSEEEEEEQRRMQDIRMNYLQMRR